MKLKAPVVKADETGYELKVITPATGLGDLLGLGDGRPPLFEAGAEDAAVAVVDEQRRELGVVPDPLE